MINTYAMYVMNIIVALFESFIAYNFFEGFLIRKWNNKAIYYGSYLLYAFISMYLSLALDNSIINLLFTFISLISLSALLYKSKMSIKIFTFIIYLGFIVTSEVLTAFLSLLIFNIKMETLQSNYFIYISGIIISKTAQYGFVKIALYTCKKLDYEIPKKFMFPLLSIPFIGIIVTLIILQSVYTYENSISWPLLVSITGVTYIVVVVFYLFEGFLRQEKEKDKSKQLEFQIKYQTDYYALLRDKHLETISIWHDINHHLSSIRSLAVDGQNQLIIQYVNELGIEFYNLSKFVETGNAVIDALLNEKMSKAQNMSIEIEYNIDLPEKLNLKIIDICIIISNALDNAIEACNRITDPSINKKVDFSIHSSNNYIYISCKNPIDRSLFCYNNEPNFTSKDDKTNHGFGISNIERSAKKYYGNVDLDFDQEHFKISIVVYNGLYAQ